jgi:hypothetical protein
MKKPLLGLVGVAAVGAALLPGIAPGGKSQQDVNVRLREFSITSAKLRPAAFGKPSVLTPGQTMFSFRNAGRVPHNFVITTTSPGATKFKTATIEPGASATLSVNLKPGAYLAVCTIFNGLHYAAGMVRPLSVGKQDQSGKWIP